MARLYDERAGEFVLSITVIGAGSGISIVLSFWKPLVDSWSAHVARARTWQRVPVVTGGDANDILSVVSQALDEFLVEYLRVNKDACGWL